MAVTVTVAVPALYQTDNSSLTWGARANQA
jgi:hypothetical protein